MGREIRRVPANWQHPKNETGRYIPLYEDYAAALAGFEKDIAEKGLSEAIEYNGGGPLKCDYVDYGGAEATWWQLYETVSEGTPVSPPFATPEELIEHLVRHGDFWCTGQGYSRKAAEAVVRGGWAPSAIAIGGKVYSGVEGLVVE